MPPASTPRKIKPLLGWAADTKKEVPTADAKHVAETTPLHVTL
jgi:hypothetical protein